MWENKCLYFKYVFIFLFTVDLFLNKKSEGIIVVSLIAIILSNIRIFYLKSEILKLGVLFIDFIVITILSVTLNFKLSFYIISIIGDIFYFKSNTRKFLIATIVVLIFKDIIIFKDILSLYAVVAIMGIYILYTHIYNLNQSKNEAQGLYDKIRISEDELRRLNKELEVYSQSIEEVSILKERNRISREIHDSVGHVLSTTMIQLSAMERVGKSQNNMLGDMAGELRNFVADSFQDVKEAVRDLKPNEYSNYECLIRISELCKNVEKFSSITIKLSVRGEKWAFTAKQGANIYRIVQEVLSNAIKHSKATKIDIIIRFYDEEMMLSIKDNGIGTENIVESGVGLKSIKERTYELFGRIHMKSKLNEGMLTKVIIPKNDGGVYGKN
ncbi:MAG: sensor histidine kinase [Sarcina sp.]